MRCASLALGVIGLMLATGCSASTDESAPTSEEDAFTGAAETSPQKVFKPLSTCIIDDLGYHSPEIDLRDRDHPRYRIRHIPLHKIDGAIEVGDDSVRGKQNINLYLRDGSVWRSEDNLISRASRLQRGEDGTFEGNSNDPWEPLPVPKEFLDKAFELKDGKYNLRAWEVVINEALSPDTACRNDFYVPAR